MSEQRPTRWLVDVKDLLEKELYLCAPFSQRPRVVSVFDIVTAPPVDAVEVVRCKDCKHSKKHRETEYLCFVDRPTIYFNKKPMGYCDRGERKPTKKEK